MKKGDLIKIVDCGYIYSTWSEMYNRFGLKMPPDSAYERSKLLLNDEYREFLKNNLFTIVDFINEDIIGVKSIYSDTGIIIAKGGIKFLKENEYKNAYSLVYKKTSSH